MQFKGQNQTQAKPQTAKEVIAANVKTLIEALHLTLADFDTDAGILIIRETKFFKSRFVPVGTDLKRVLRDYIDKPWKGRLHDETTPLLGTHRGHCYLCSVPTGTAL